jgi:hypothetical protein
MMRGIGGILVCLLLTGCASIANLSQTPEERAFFRTYQPESRRFVLVPPRDVDLFDKERFIKNAGPQAGDTANPDLFAGDLLKRCLSFYSLPGSFRFDSSASTDYFDTTVFYQYQRIIQRKDAMGMPLPDSVAKLTRPLSVRLPRNSRTSPSDSNPAFSLVFTRLRYFEDLYIGSGRFGDPSYALGIRLAGDYIVWDAARGKVVLIGSIKSRVTPPTLLDGISFQNWVWAMNSFSMTFLEQMSILNPQARGIDKIIMADLSYLDTYVKQPRRDSTVGESFNPVDSLLKVR